MKNYEKILIFAFAGYQLRKSITRRYLATVSYICSNLLNENIITVYDVYPDGVESEEINLYIDYLASKQYFFISGGLISITSKGKAYVKELLMNPDMKIARIYYRAANEVWLLDTDLSIAIASYLYFSQFSDEIKGFHKIKKIYEEIKDYISIFLTKKESEKIKKKRKV